MVVAGSGVPEDIPEVMWSMGTAPGAPVMVLGGRLVDVPVVPEVGVEELGPELLGELDGLELGEGLEELELELELGFCLSASC